MGQACWVIIPGTVVQSARLCNLVQRVLEFATHSRENPKSSNSQNDLFARYFPIRVIRRSGKNSKQTFIPACYVMYNFHALMAWCTDFSLYLHLSIEGTRCKVHITKHNMHPYCECKGDALSLSFQWCRLQFFNSCTEGRVHYEFSSESDMSIFLRKFLPVVQISFIHCIPVPVVSLTLYGT